MKNGGWLNIPTRIGSHTLTAKPNGEKSFSFPILTPENMRYFVRITPAETKSFLVIPIGNTIYTSATVGAWGVETVPEELARNELSKLKRSD